jgi:hypothetical protein
MLFTEITTVLSENCMKPNQPCWTFHWSDQNSCFLFCSSWIRYHTWDHLSWQIFQSSAIFFLGKYKDCILKEGMTTSFPCPSHSFHDWLDWFHWILCIFCSWPVGFASFSRIMLFICDLLNHCVSTSNHVWNRSAYKVLVGKPEGNRSWRRLRHRWKDNIKMLIKELG